METPNENSAPEPAGIDVRVDALVVPCPLLNFCDPEDEKLLAPWSVGDWTYASDGHVAIRVPRVEGIVRGAPFEEAKTIPWEPAEPGEWVDLPEYVLPVGQPCRQCSGTGKVATCPECDGEGTLEFSTSYNTYDVDCDSCNGSGAVKGHSNPCDNCNGTGVIRDSACPVDFGGVDKVKIDGLLLEKIKNLPGVKLFSKPTRYMFHYRFDGGDGIIMGLRF